MYSLPAVAMKVLELTNNPQVDTRALKECIENDPALTSRILGVVNSSLFGLSREVSDLNQALAMLGSKPLKLLVLGFSLPAGLFCGIREEVLGRYWRHTLTKAVAGREISETLWNTPGDDAFIAGLLQDLGMLLLIQELEGPYVNFLDKAQAAGRDLAALEIESMGFDHTELSARLLAHWGLPETLIEAVDRHTPHGRPDDAHSGPRALPQILHLAELVARLLADGCPDVLVELLEVGQQYRDFTQSRLEALVDNLEEKIEQLADVLSLELPEGMDYRDVLVQAHAQLAEVASEAAGDILLRRQGEVPRSEEEALLVELRDLAAAVARVSGLPAEPDIAGPPPRPETAPQGDPRGRTAAKHGRPAKGAAVEADPGLLGRLGVGVAACRQSRCPLSLLLVQLDRLDELAVDPGLKGLDSLRQSLETVCWGVDLPGTTCLAHGEAGFALILPNCERRLAVELGGQLIGQFRRAGPSDGVGGERTVGLSVGAATVALPPKNFRPEDLFAAADRCLYGSRAAGGGVVKSIEIY